MSKASLAQWLRRLETLHPRQMELGLERVSRVANTLQLLPVPQPVVTVAGTNGKGSTVAVLEALLEEAGYNTGVFTSPHLLRFNERIRVGGVEVADEEIIDAFMAIDAARAETSLTYFEFATLAALLIFRARAPQFIILEVGLGGRLDAVNIVDPAVAVITSIDLDHQAWLGDSRGAIAREKAGILRRAVPTVIADPDPPPELSACVAKVGAAPVFRLGSEIVVARERGTWSARLRQANGETRQLAPRPAAALLPENICAAVQAALLLNIDLSDDCLSRALDRSAPAGRREVLHVDGRQYVLDVAHNPAAVTKLLEYLNVMPCNGRTFCLFSVMSDKDIQAMTDLAAGSFDGWYLADQPDNKRAARAVDIAVLLEGAGQRVMRISDNLQQAFRQAQGVLAAGDRLVVFGSFYTVAGVLPLLDRQDQQREAT